MHPEYREARFATLRARSRLFEVLTAFVSVVAVLGVVALAWIPGVWWWLVAAQVYVALVMTKQQGYMQGQLDVIGQATDEGRR